MLSPELHRLCAATTGDESALDIDEARQVQLVQLAQRHRVEPYLYASTPQTKWHPLAAQMLQLAYQRNAQRVLIAQSWTQRLITTLAGAGIETRPLKGLPLAAQAYDRISDRHCGDIDLLIADVANRGRVEALLHGLGLNRKAFRARRGRQVHEFLAKTDEYFSADGQRLEVHYLNHREARAIFPAFLGFQSGSWEDGRLRGAPLLLYLLSHGLRQGWMRLKWVLDIHRLTRNYGEREWQQLHAAAAHARLLAAYQTGIGLLHLTLGHAPAPERAARSSTALSFCLRWLNEAREPTGLLSVRALRPPYKMLALPGFWPRFSYLSSLVLR